METSCILGNKIIKVNMLGPSLAVIYMSMNMINQLAIMVSLVYKTVLTIQNQSVKH